MGDEEKRLIRQAQVGDPTAFAEPFRRTQPKVYRHITFRVDSEATAEDLSSEFFVWPVERIQASRYLGRPPPLMKVAYSVCGSFVTSTECS